MPPIMPLAIDFFHTATKAACAYAQSDDLEIRPLDDSARHDISTRWQKLAAQLPNASEHKDRDIPYLLRSLNGQHRETPSYGLWSRRMLVATALVDINDYHYKKTLTTAHVAGCPGQHPLKGKILATIHRINTALAEQRGDESLRYMASFSTGTLKQIERGAIPISVAERNRMWDGNSINIAIHPDSNVALHIPGDPPPIQACRAYHEAYQLLFGKPYPIPKFVPVS